MTVTVSQRPSSPQNVKLTVPSSRVSALLKMLTLVKQKQKHSIYPLHHGKFRLSTILSFNLNLRPVDTRL